MFEEEFNNQVIAWHKANINATKEQQYEKVLIEDKELGQAKSIEEKALEFADVDLCLIAYVGLGGDLEDFGDELKYYYTALDELPIDLITTAILFKFEVNKNRKFGLVNNEHRHI